jgi:hypothetical protein
VRIRWLRRELRHLSVGRDVRRERAVRRVVHAQLHGQGVRIRWLRRELRHLSVGRKVQRHRAVRSYVQGRELPTLSTESLTGLAPRRAVG